MKVFKPIIYKTNLQVWDAISRVRVFGKDKIGELINALGSRRDTRKATEKNGTNLHSDPAN